MITADAGSMPKVIGSSSDSVAAGPEARQDADRGADEDADQAVEQVVGGKRDREAQLQVRQEVQTMASRPRPV